MPAPAAVLASSFGSGDTFLSTLYPIGSPVFQEDIAADFTPGFTATLDTIRVAVSFQSGLNDFTVYIAPDIAGAPGLPLESFTGLSFPAMPSILTLSSVSHPLLTEGSRYWIVIAAADPANAQGAWYANDQGLSGVLARNVFGNFVWTLDPESPTPAFDVRGSAAVPEPSTFPLALAGLAAAFIRHNHPPCAEGSGLRS
jgi:hypothetical protein